MNTKTILGISLAAAFAVSMILAQNAYAGVPVLTASVEPQDKNGNRYVYSWDPANLDLPRVADDVILHDDVVGFGVAVVTFTSDSDVTFTGATIHPPARDNRQNPIGWHPHTGTAHMISPGEFCLTSLNSPHAGMSNIEDTFRMSMSSADAANTPIGTDEKTDWQAAITFELEVDEANCLGQTPELKGGDGWGNGIKQLGPELPGLKVVIDELSLAPTED
jgi:hypothetical protein